MGEYPTHLRSTCLMLARAYPRGLAVGDRDFPTVVTMLASKCSQRNAAEVLELVFAVDPGVSHNEVLRYAYASPPADDLARVHERLAPHGFADWLAEDW